MPSSGSAGVCAVEGQRLVAAQLDPVRIADRRDRGEAVERAAQHDDEQARIAAFGERELGRVGPGEQRAGCEQQLAAGGCVEINGHWFISRSNE